MSAAIESVRVGLSELGIDVPPDVSDSGLKDWLDTVLDDMQNGRTIGAAGATAGATPLGPQDNSFGDSLLDDQSGAVTPRTKSLREIVPCNLRRQDDSAHGPTAQRRNSCASGPSNEQGSHGSVPSYMSIGDRGGGAATATAQTRNDAFEAGQLEISANLPASISMNGACSPVRRETNAIPNDNQAHPGVPPTPPEHASLAEAAAQHDPTHFNVSNADHGQSDVEDEYDTEVPSPPRRSVVVGGDGVAEHPKIRRGRLMNVVSAIPVHPPSSRAARCDSQTAPLGNRACPASSLSHSQSARRHDSVAKSRQQQQDRTNANHKPLSARARGYAYSNNSRLVARSRARNQPRQRPPLPQPRPYGLASDRDRFRQKGGNRRYRNTSSSVRYAGSSESDCDSDESSSDSEYDDSEEENAPRDRQNRRRRGSVGGRPQSSYGGDTRPKPRSRGGFKTSDPVALYHRFKKGWESDRFLKKKKPLMGRA